MEQLLGLGRDRSHLQDCIFPGYLRQPRNYLSPSRCSISFRTFCHLVTVWLLGWSFRYGSLGYCTRMWTPGFLRIQVRQQHRWLDFAFCVR